MNIGEPRRHHYIPKFHQSKFADEDERLWVYDRRKQMYRKVHPVNVCCENDLYTLDPRGQKYSLIESRFLALVDGEGATAIRKFENREALDPEWRQSFSVFMAQILTRSPAFRDLMSRSYQLMGEEFLRIGFSDANRAGDMVERYRRRTGEKLPAFNAEAGAAMVRGGHFTVSVTERPFLEHMLMSLDSFAKSIFLRAWQVVAAPTDTGFIICDYPFVVVPPINSPESIGLGCPGVAIYFPAALLALK